MSVELKNKLNQAVPTLVLDKETGKYKEVRVPPRGKLVVEGDLSSLTESQILNGIFKTKKSAAPASPSGT